MECAHHLDNRLGAGTYFAALLERYVELKNNPVAPYPKNSPVKPMIKEKKPAHGIELERIKAFFNL